jgi:hypothetical protein
LEKLINMEVGCRYWVPALSATVVLREQHVRIGIYFFEVLGGARDGKAVHLTRDTLERMVIERAV